MRRVRVSLKRVRVLPRKPYGTWRPSHIVTFAKGNKFYTRYVDAVNDDHAIELAKRAFSWTDECEVTDVCKW